jgi:hypothetical protein
MAAFVGLLAFATGEAQKQSSDIATARFFSSENSQPVAPDTELAHVEQPQLLRLPRVEKLSLIDKAHLDVFKHFKG